MSVTPRFQAPQASNDMVERFRTEILAAEQRGASRDDMRLHLTLRDDAALRRNRTLDVAELRYADGGVVFMGVRVISGGVERSALVTAPENPAE